MNRFVLTLSAVTMLIVSSTAEARIFGNRRGGGNMGGNGVCNMNLCPVSAAKCVGGNCNLAAPASAAPAAVLTVPEDVSYFYSPSKSKKVTEKAFARKESSKYRFDVELELNPESVASN